MGFIIRRGQQALANWHDEFNRANENPIKQPWGVWGVAPTTARLESNHMVFGVGSSWFNFGGWSFEQQCFTETWSCTFILQRSLSGLAAQTFRTIFSAPWSRMDQDFSKVFVIDLQYRSIGHRIYGATFEDIDTIGAIWQEASLPSNMFDGNPHEVRYQIEYDAHVQVFVDDIMVLWFSIPEGDYRPFKDKRAINYMSGITEEVILENFKLYDRAPNYPRNSGWGSAIFSDNFNRANSSTVGNGWTQMGSNMSINGNELGIAAGLLSDGGRAVLRNSGITNGKQRITAMVGSTHAIDEAVCTSLILRSNSAGTQGLAANVFLDRIYIARFSTALNGGTTFTDYRYYDVPLANRPGAGEVVGFSTWGSLVWVDIDNIIVNGWIVDSVVPESNSYVGFRMDRQSFVNSWSIEEMALYTL